MNITKASARQRKGRVGRVSPGEWYPLYTPGIFEMLPDYEQRLYQKIYVI